MLKDTTLHELEAMLFEICVQVQEQGAAEGDWGRFEVWPEHVEADHIVLSFDRWNTPDGSPDIGQDFYSSVCHALRKALDIETDIVDVDNTWVEIGYRLPNLDCQPYRDTVEGRAQRIAHAYATCGFEGVVQAFTRKDIVVVVVEGPHRHGTAFHIIRQDPRLQKLRHIRGYKARTYRMVYRVLPEPRPFDPAQVLYRGLPVATRSARE